METFEKHNHLFWNVYKKYIKFFFIVLYYIDKNSYITFFTYNFIHFNNYYIILYYNKIYYYN